MRVESPSAPRSGPLEQRNLGRAREEKRFRIDMVIFLSVNAVLLMTWASLSVAGVQLHGALWPWAVVVALWSVRLFIEGRSAYGEKVDRRTPYSEERIRKEMDRLP